MKTVPCLSLSVLLASLTVPAKCQNDTGLPASTGEYARRLLLNLAQNDVASAVASHQAWIIGRFSPSYGAPVKHYKGPLVLTLSQDGPFQGNVWIVASLPKRLSQKRISYQISSESISYFDPDDARDADPLVYGGVAMFPLQETHGQIKHYPSSMLLVQKKDIPQISAAYYYASAHQATFNPDRAASHIGVLKTLMQSQNLFLALAAEDTVAESLADHLRQAYPLDTPPPPPPPPPVPTDSKGNIIPDSEPLPSLPPAPAPVLPPGFAGNMEAAVPLEHALAQGIEQASGYKQTVLTYSLVFYACGATADDAPVSKIILGVIKNASTPQQIAGMVRGLEAVGDANGHGPLNSLPGPTLFEMLGSPARKFWLTAARKRFPGIK